VVLPTSPGRTDSATATFGPGGGIESGREIGAFRPGILRDFGEDGLPMAEPDGDTVAAALASARGVGSDAGIG